jgi:very-short-patch-repair endonuclease
MLQGALFFYNKKALNVEVLPKKPLGVLFLTSLRDIALEEFNGQSLKIEGEEHYLEGIIERTLKETQSGGSLEGLVEVRGVIVDDTESDLKGRFQLLPIDNNWIFPVDTAMSFGGAAPDDKLKWQRMNVGFSRAKECIHFVLSKPIENFQGEIKNAMLHYQNELEIGKKRIVKKLDSKMEYEVDEIFHNTKFYKENKEKIEFIPQFELGKYLKQLNKDYNHPNYKVDFLLIFNGLKIVIEYDGFKEHFVDREEVNESNYKYYMKDDDIYRQKVLEGYGYKFLRINRFNIGDDPIETLDNRLQNLVKKNFKIK